MNEKITTLENEIRMDEEKLTSNAVLREEVATKLAEVKKEISDIEQSAPAPIAAQVEAKRRKRAADVVLGRMTAQDAAVAEREDVKTLKVFESEAATSQQALVKLRTDAGGLQDELDALEAEGKSLLEERDKELGNYLLANAEEAGKAYVSAVRMAVAAMDRVIVYASIHKRVGGVNHIGDGVGAFDAPPLGVDSTRGTLPSFDPAASNARYDAAEVEIIDRLKREGISVPSSASATSAAPAPVVEKAAVNSATKLKEPPGGIIASFVEKPRKVPLGAATPVDPHNPNALRGPGLDFLPTEALRD
jgi:hypothetical protein